MAEQSGCCGKIKWDVGRTLQVLKENNVGKPIKMMESKNALEGNRCTDSFEEANGGDVERPQAKAASIRTSSITHKDADVGRASHGSKEPVVRQIPPCVAPWGPERGFSPYSK